MKKLLTILFVVCLMFMSTAFAVEPIAINIHPVNIDTGRVCDPEWAENTLFALKVNVEIPRFYDITNLKPMIEIDGVEITNCDFMLANGEYFIEGIVKELPAKVTVKIVDEAYDNAETAEELYLAQQEDRTVAAGYVFNRGKANEVKPIYIPKTGDKGLFAWLFK